MCGFAGVIDLNHLDVNEDLDKRMLASLESLHNRGPDQKGTYKDDYSYLVHARLSIIDTSDSGKQPMTKYGKTIVYNGEIYNFKELKNELQKAGYEFFSNSDTEVLLAAWDMWGAEALNYIKIIEELVGKPIDIISTGPHRTETIVVRDIVRF